MGEQRGYADPDPAGGDWRISFNEINESGVVVGHIAASHGTLFSQAFVWTEESGIIPIPPEPDRPVFQNTTGNGINDANTIVGTAYNDWLGQSAGYMWLPGSAPVGLNDLISKEEGWRITGANDINSSGWIIGTGTKDGVTYAVTLFPVPLPATLPLLGAALAGLGVSGRRQPSGTPRTRLAPEQQP